MTEGNDPELGSITREMYIDATPDIVYEVVSQPEHITQWWSDELTLDGDEPGASGVISFGEPDGPDFHAESFQIVEAVPPTTFSFHWCYPDDDAELAGRALLVTFTLTPRGAGTWVSMTETGFREKGWEAAVLEQIYHDHVQGWGQHLPVLIAYAEQVGARRTAPR
ncbi:polyketide cyclase [Gordonia sp. TBRC 11910]|uniref:Polyketide cyclase n=1 Tax=Gordonia asplenii TaxID=2725283 RepID=A0A848L277_9ACTN|nr:SRPBCC domain-containing protein [Gordonia asplenii]NMO04532.1 polyketide cyclase [Gordonia asplenii]